MCSLINDNQLDKVAGGVLLFTNTQQYWAENHWEIPAMIASIALGFIIDPGVELIKHILNGTIESKAMQEMVNKNKKACILDRIINAGVFYAKALVDDHFTYGVYGGLALAGGFVLKAVTTVTGKTICCEDMRFGPQIVPPNREGGQYISVMLPKNTVGLGYVLSYDERSGTCNGITIYPPNKPPVRLDIGGSRIKARVASEVNPS